MNIKINLKLLDTQIRECDIKVDNASTEEERDIFEGIANLLSHIAFAIKNGEEIYIERGVTK